MSYLPHTLPSCGRLSPPIIRGFTLMELMVAMALLAIIATLAVPAMGDFIQRNRLSSQVNGLVASLSMARNHAVTRRREVVVCKQSGSELCDSSAEWQQGWVVFTDLNRDRQRQADEPLLQAHGPLDSPTSVDFRAFGSSTYIVYYPNGIPRSSNGSFTFCAGTNSSTARVLIMSKTGRLRVSNTYSDGSEPDCS